MKKIFLVHYQSIYLSKLLSYAVRIKDFNESDLKDMKKVASRLFKAYCLFNATVAPSLWTLCNVAPVHAEKCLSSYSLGLGCNTMDGREQKYQVIEKYSHNTTFQNSWPKIFRHEFIQLVCLMENGYDDCIYRKKNQIMCQNLVKKIVVYVGYF